MTKEEVAANHPTISELNDLIVDAIQDIKGKDIVKIDLSQIEEAPADYFIICSGDSSTQVSSIAGNIIKRAKDELRLKVPHKEGMDNGTWVLVDFFDTIVHIFHRETRRYYDLEDLWNDGETTEYQNL